MIIISEKQIESFRNFLESHDSFIIAGHKEPDGDCISSCMGLSFILEKTGKPYIMLNAGPFKRNEIKEYAKYFRNDVPFMTQSERDNCGLIITDCSEISRLGELDGDIRGFDTFIIDHHKTSDASGDNSIIDPTSPAPCAAALRSRRWKTKRKRGKYDFLWNLHGHRFFQVPYRKQRRSIPKYSPPCRSRCKSAKNVPEND